MSSPPTINRFKGTGWEECNEFILAIRAAAWKEGKFRDLAWVADFAALHFSHKALTWHSRLPQDVRRDWEKLEVALLERWTPPEEDDEPRIEPTPAAAPSLNPSDRADRPLQGVLKMVVDGSHEKSYFQLDENGRGTRANNTKDALRFRCSSLPNTTILERIDESRHHWLAIQWRNSSPNLKNGSKDYGHLVLVDSLTLKTSWGMNYLYQVASCTLSTDGELIPVWGTNDTSKITVGIFRDDSGLLCVAPDPAAYWEFSEEERVKIFLEPID